MTQPSVLSPQSSTLSPHSWLITGGCGFIGTALIKHLVKNNLATHIRVLDNLTVGTREDLAQACNFNEIDASALSPQSLVLKPQSSTLSPENNHAPKVELIVGDIRDPETCEKCCQNIDVIIHLAANTGVPQSVADPRLDMECNVIGTFNMLEAARTHKVNRFVFASSGAPAGEVEPPIHEELPPHPVSPYGASKLAGEGYCSTYYKTFGVETVALRFSNVYGPGSTHKSSVVAKFMKLGIEGRTLEVYGDGQQTRDFIYIDDLIKAIVLSATRKGIGGETFQIATSQETALNELLDAMLPIMEKRGITRPTVKYSEKRLGDVKRNFSDTTKAKTLLGWKATTELTEGLEKTVSYYTSNIN